MINMVRITGKKIMNVPFLDLKREYRNLHKQINAAIKRVVVSGHYVLGKEVKEFENAFASYIGVRYAIGVASGTDALLLSLLACDIKPKDEVIAPANTCGPTISAIVASGAIPVLADVNSRTYCMDAISVRGKITKKTKAVIPVHLYGQTSDMTSLARICRKYRIAIIEDCAQALGARYKDKMAGAIGKTGAFSFYPTKNIGALGDGGIISTDSKKVADKCRLLRNYGQKNRYEHVLSGFNSRLDELQAAVLGVKLKKVNGWNKKRRDIAKQYSKNISNENVILPCEDEHSYHVYHLYVVQVKSRQRFQGFLAGHGISSLIHYPIPIHRQKFYLDNYGSKGDFPITDSLSDNIVSLPLYPYMKKSEIDYIIKIVNSYRA